MAASRGYAYDASRHRRRRLARGRKPLQNRREHDAAPAPSGVDFDL